MLLRTLSRLMLAGALLITTAIPASAANDGRGKGRGKLDLALQGAAGSGGEFPVIIRTRPGARKLTRVALESRGHKVAREHAIIEALSANVSADDLAALANHPLVESVSLDAEVTAHGRKSSRSTKGSTTTTSSTTNLESSFVRQVAGIGSWVGGSSLAVALVDSGIQPNDDFLGRLLAQYDFHNDRGGVAVAPYDDHGHGTHVAGLIGSSGALSGGKYAGIAAAVKFASFKVLDKNGKGRTSDVIAALERILQLKDTHGIKVVNLSLGHPIYEPASSDPLVLAVEAAVRAGVVVVVAAGNYGTNPATGLTGYAGITSPGNAPSAITVGAANAMGTVALNDDQVARYSSRGPTWYDGMAKPDIVAPGQGLISDLSLGGTLTTQFSDQIVIDPTSTKKFLRLSGSSMSTAIVSGMTVLMLEANRLGAEQRARQRYGGKYINTSWTRPADLSPNSIKAALQYTAVRLLDPAQGVPYDRLTQGAGALNGLGAAYLAYCLDTTAAPGAQWLAYELPPETTIDGVTLAWSQEVIWGTNVLSGAGLVDIRQTAWAQGVVWGTGADGAIWGALLDSDNIVWGTSIFAGSDVVWGGLVMEGDNIVWGTAVDWGDNIVWGTSLVGIFDGDNIVWGTFDDGDNIVWGTLDDDNVVWGTDYKVFGQLVAEGGL